MFVCERELETEQNCNTLTPPFLWPSESLSRQGTQLSAGCWLSLPHLVSKLVWSPKLTDGLSSPSYIIVHAHLLFVGVTNCTHSTHPRLRLYSAIPRPDAPVIYIGAFPILTARPGRRSIYKTCRDVMLQKFKQKA